MDQVILPILIMRTRSPFLVPIILYRIQVILDTQPILVNIYFIKLHINNQQPKQLKFEKLGPFPKLKSMKWGPFPKPKSTKWEELKVLVNLFKFLKSKELKKELLFKTIKLLKNTTDLTSIKDIPLQDTENMEEFQLIILKEKQNLPAVAHVAGLFGVYSAWLELF